MHSLCGSHALHHTPAGQGPGPTPKLGDGDNISWLPTGTAQEGPGRSPWHQPESPGRTKTWETQGLSFLRDAFFQVTD